MNTYIKKIGITIFATFMMCYSNTYSNGAVFGGVGNIVIPLHSENIQLEYEQIFINITNGIEIECYFHLLNFGDSTNVQLGFPINFHYYGDITNKFSVRDCGTQEFYKIEVKSNDTYGILGTWPMNIKKNEKKLLYIKYQISYSGGSYDPYNHFSYILETGSMWKGVIKNCDIYIYFDKLLPKPIISASPHNYLYTGQSIEWHFQNVKPTTNIEFLITGVGNDKITPMMFNPMQADINDDYMLDELFYKDSPLTDGEQDKIDCFITDRSFTNIYKPDQEFKVKLSQLTNKYLILRNEIYARHGYIFKTKELLSYFQKFKWYKLNNNFDENLLNDIEKRNVEYFLNKEKVFIEFLK